MSSFAPRAGGNGAGPGGDSRDFLGRLRGGETLLGTLIVSTSPAWPRALEGSGLDFVFLDTEHIPLDRGPLGWMCQAYGRMGLPPLVRVPSPDPFAAAMALDAGAAGLVVPYVESASQVQALRGAVKFRPVKGERLARRLSGEEFEPALEDYLKARNSHPLIANIESVPALQALDEILAVPGLDAVLIGPHDLSCSLGLPERYDHPEFLRACGTVLHKARRAGLGAGIHCLGEAEDLARFNALGANLLIYASDLALFPRSLRRDLRAFQGLRGTRRELPSASEEIPV